MKQLGLLFCVAASLWARSAETVYFRAVMLPSNEVPAVAIDASGSATIRAHVVRDDAGQVTEGSVDFVVSYAFPGAVTITGLHIHNGPAGVNAGVTINTGLSAAMDYAPRSAKSQFKVADREGATHCLVLGGSELQSGTVVLKDLKAGQQTTVPQAEVVGKLRAM
jgi:hypothetical protein